MQMTIFALQHLSCVSWLSVMICILIAATSVSSATNATLPETLQLAPSASILDVSLTEGNEGIITNYSLSK